MYLTQWYSLDRRPVAEYKYLFDITFTLDGPGSPFSREADSMVAKL